jgi:hypothetical protein
MPVEILVASTINRVTEEISLIGALFEPFELDGFSCSELRSDDLAFQKALELLDLTFDPLS